jgi:hypothetical protein
LKDLREILVGRLAVSAVGQRLNLLADQINKNINPPRQATPDNVNIRVMYLLNDLVNTHGGRFRKSDLLNLCRLIVDTPVLIGHDRSSAPLARNFHAEIEQKNGILWLRSYFYWPKAADGKTDRLLDMIDSGVLKECSISFVYTLPECSECGQDIRSCPHEINQSTEDAEEGGVHFIYNGITQVLETSLVYKGSVKGTYISDHLRLDPNNEILIRAGVNIWVIPLDESLVMRSPSIILPVNVPGTEEIEIASTLPGTAACLAAKEGRRGILLRRIQGGSRR